MNNITRQTTFNPTQTFHSIYSYMIKMSSTSCLRPVSWQVMDFSLTPIDGRVNSSKYGPLVVHTIIIAFARVAFIVDMNGAL